MVSNRIQKSLAGWFKGPDLKPAAVFLVGGAVRDHLLKRPCADLDLVCPDADGFARRLADTCKASLVRFEKKPGQACFRVIDRENRDDFIDLAELRNSNISDDLARRDFTINAMARPIDRGGRLGNLIDPHSGLSDLNGKIVRMVASDAFVNDPLRILRAWRFAAELGFRVETATRKHLSDQTQRLKTVAVERITYELFRLLRVINAGQFFREMARTPILETLFPEKAATFEKSAHPVAWDNALAVMDRIETILGSAATHFEDAGAQVTEYLKSGNRGPLLKLAALHSDFGQLDEDMAVRMAERVGRRLKISNRDRAFFQCVLTGPKDAFAITTLHPNRSVWIDFFKSRGDDGVGVLVLGLAILSVDAAGGAVGLERLPGSQSLRQAIIAYYSGIRTKLAEKALIVGQDLIDRGVSPGPQLGAVLREVRQAQDEGRVTSRSEALEWAQQFLSLKD